MSEAWIIDAARTPRGVGKQGKGALWEIHPQKLLSTVLGALAQRNDLNTEDVDDVIISCSSQIKKQGACIGRMAALDAGYSIKASGVTLDRFCGGGGKHIRGFDVRGWHSTGHHRRIGHYVSLLAAEWRRQAGGSRSGWLDGNVARCVGRDS